MLKYSVSLGGDVNLFYSTFKSTMESMFSFVSISMDTSNQTRISVTDTNLNKEIMYCFVIPTTYNNRQTLLLKTYGLNIYPLPFTNEDSSDWGPMIIYNSSGTEYGRAGFITAENQLFLVDSISYCLDSSNNVKNFISFDYENNANPMFIISPTNLGNVGFLGIMSMSNATTNIRTLTYNNNRTVEHNLYTNRIINSSVTSLTRFFIPESSNSEYFKYLYLINGLENINTNMLKYDGHIYLACMNSNLAILIF